MWQEINIKENKHLVAIAKQYTNVPMCVDDGYSLDELNDAVVRSYFIFEPKYIAIMISKRDNYNKLLYIVSAYTKEETLQLVKELELQIGKIVVTKPKDELEEYLKTCL